MSALIEVERLALGLPEKQRAILAAHLLDSLPALLHDADEEITEALARDADLEAHPDTGLSLEQLDEAIARRHS
ncbi:MAG: addiction module protein [Verrucomicrobiota bacterium]